MTDLQQVLDSGQAMDITQYANKDTIPTWDSIDPALKEVFTDGGKLYAVPVKNYSMGLVYNKALFSKAGLDVEQPAQDLGRGPGRRQEDLRARRRHRRLLGVQRRQHRRLALHLRALLAGRPGADRRTARRPTSTTPMGKQVLQNLKDMRYGDNSMGTRQLLQWGDLLTNAGAGKVGMFIGAPGRHPGDRQPVPGQVPGLGDGPAARPGRRGEGHARRRRGLLLQEGPHPRRRSRPV